MKLRLLIILLISFFLLPCQAKEKPATLTVVLDWVVNPNHAPLLVAEQHKFFEEEGIKVKLIAPSDPNEGPKWVATKKADVAITYQPQLLLQVDEGLPLVRFGSLVPTPLSCLVTLKANHIDKIADLKNQLIGYSSGAIDQIMLKVMLEKNQLNLTEVKLINVRYDLIQSLLTGNVAAFTGGMRNIEPVQLQQTGYPVQVFYPEDNGFPSYEELIFVTHRDQIKDPRLLPFLRALQKGQQYLVSHPDETWSEVIKKYPDMDDPLNKAAWKESIPYFAKDPVALPVDRYQQLAEFFLQQGVITQIHPIEDYAVQLN